MFGPSLKSHCTRSHCTLALAVVVTMQFCISAAARADEAHARDMQTDVIAHLHEVATVKLSLAQARYDRHALRLQGLAELHRWGYASFREITNARLLSATLTANLSSAKQLCEFVENVASQSSDAPPSPGDTSAVSTTTLTIPGLASDVRTQAISRVKLPLTIDASAALETQTTACTQLRNHITARVKAWESLAHRLDEINDGSRSVINEHAIALLEQRVAEAEYDVATLSLNTVTMFHSVSPFQVEGTTITTAADALAVFDAEANRMQHVAAATASKAHLTLLNELSRRIAIAAQGGASPPAELPSIQRMIAATEHGQVAAEAIVDSISSEAIKSKTIASNERGGAATDDEVRLVSVNSATSLTAAQLASIGDVTLTRVLDASDVARAAMNRHDSLRLKLEKVAALAAQDSFFQQELVRLRMEVAVAKAAVAHAEFDHQRLALEHEYASARINNQPVATWLETLRSLYTLQATSTSTQQLQQRRLDLQQWRVAGVTRLYHDGAASWKEMTAAIVQRDEIAEAQQRAEIDQTTAKLILETLNRWADLLAAE